VDSLFLFKSSRATVQSGYFMGAIEYWLRKYFNPILLEHTDWHVHAQRNG
jgi:hypothetical protein